MENTENLYSKLTFIKRKTNMKTNIEAQIKDIILNSPEYFATKEHGETFDLIAQGAGEIVVATFPIEYKEFADELVAQQYS